MRRPQSLHFRASGLVCCVSLARVRLAPRRPPEAHVGDRRRPADTAAADKTAPAAGDDDGAAAGVDISKLDDFGKKVFFRIVNSEASVCGKAQSLIQSAKEDKRRAGAR